jgi:hypothetical protein
MIFNNMKIKQVIVWGHKLHSHTHSYIHNGFFIGFNDLGFKTHWFDDNDNVKDFDFTNSLFITEHQVNKRIPLRDDCLYLTHYLDDGDYKNIPKENIIVLNVSLRDFDEKGSIESIYTPLNYGQKYEYHAKVEDYNCLYMYWATDLLPKEIDLNIQNIHNIKSINEINLIGTQTSVWNELANICNMNNIKFKKFGATFNIHSNDNISINKNIELIQQSLISPALQDEQQVIKNYIPCRIFKNISYGKMGITNNPIVNELFDNNLIYDSNLDELFKKSIAFEMLPNKHDIIIKYMKYVRDNHTYINRINTIKEYIKDYTSFILEI